MRINVYSEELTQRVEIVESETSEGGFIGVRFHLELPVTIASGSGRTIHRGPFVAGERDRSAAVTLWGKSTADIRSVLARALFEIDQHTLREP